MECFSEWDAMSYALCRVKQLHISENYRKEIIRWIDVYLDPRNMENRLRGHNAFPEDFSIKEAAEKDLEFAILFAEEKDRKDSSVILFESQLILLFNLMLNEINDTAS